MRTHFGLALLTAAALLAACRGEPSAPPTTNRDLVLAATVQPAVAICEKNWLYPRDGDWDDSTNWFPTGVPTSTDDVCISASVPDTFTITITDDAEADSVYIGPGLNVTLDGPTLNTLEVSEELVVDAGAELSVELSTLHAFDVINDGSLTLGPTTFASFDGRLVNTGSLMLDGYQLSVESVVNSGDIRVLRQLSMSCPGDFEWRNGRLTGTGRLTVDGGFSGGRFIWTGGTLPMADPTTGLMQLVLNDMDLTLGSTTLSGAIATSSNGRSVTGPIGSSVDLWVSPSLGPGPRATLYSGTGAPLVVQGTLTLDVPIGSTIAMPDGLLNSGTVAWRGITGQLDTPSIINYGTFDVSATLRLGSASPTAVTNFATLAATAPSMVDLLAGSFVAVAGSTQSGRLRAAGTVSGTGRLGIVVGNGTTITPGGATLGTLTVDGLVLSAADTVRLDAAGPTQFDRLRVNGEATYAGHLDVVAGPAFAGVAGSCGQVLPMVTDRNSATAHPPGAFATFANTPGGLNRFWRAHYAVDSVLVTGYDPTVAIHTTLSGPLAEGGTPATGFVCLGLAPQGGATQASLSAATGEFTVQPSALTFTAADWALPRPVRYTAVDDARSEGPHGDNLVFSLSGGGAPWGLTPPRPRFAIADNDPAVDLAISMVSANPPALVNQGIDRRFRVTNLGPGASTGSTVTITGLTGMTYSTSAGAASCTFAASTLTCTIGAIASGGSLEFVVLFTASSAAGTYTNTLRLAGRDWDNDTSNNTLAWVQVVN